MKNKKVMLLLGFITLVIICAILFYPNIRGNTKEQMKSISQTEIKRPQAQKGMRGDPYNEIIIAYRNFNEIKAGVYNDIGNPLISRTDLAKINVEDVKKQFGATAVIKNGPRFWVMDEITGYFMGKERVIAGHKMKQPGVIEISKEDMENRPPYNVNEVSRKTIYTFYSGEMVYELVNERGEVFRMQSGSAEIDPDLTIEDLDKLGARLNLPSGWKYQVRVLDKNETIEIDGLAYVIQDEFRNVYQKKPS